MDTLIDRLLDRALLGRRSLLAALPSLGLAVAARLRSRGRDERREAAPPRAARRGRPVWIGHI
jgi:hypothetical protein